MSSPAPPSIVSAAVPPVNTLLLPSPVRLTATLEPLAFTFSKPVTFAVSPELWSANDRLIVAAPFTTSVSMFAPPEIRLSKPS